MPLYDFTCEAGHTTEARQGYGVASIPCPLCGGNASRAEFNQVSVEIRGPDTESKTRKGNFRVSEFEEAAAEVDYVYSQAEKREGREVKAPNLYKKGLQEAKRRGAKMRV